MTEKIEGYLYQEYEPTPDDPCEIKTIICNDIEIPVEFLKQNFVTVDGKKYIELQQENKQLKLDYKLYKDNCVYRNYEVEIRDNTIKQLKEVIEKVREYLTSYSSIHTIQFGTEEDNLNDIELNKELDIKTLTEMTNRYLMVHDKLLQILDKIK